jgi:hypothetical protein
MALSMVTLVTLPEISHRSVADWPRWMVVGSILNWPMVGVAEGLVDSTGVVAVVGAGGGGGGGGGAFFLQPAANIARQIAIQRTVNFRLRNMNIVS